MKSLLLVLLAFTGLTAAISGLLMIGQPDGSLLQLPLSLLGTTPFSNYLIPGIILAGVVGGINLLAFYVNLRRHASWYQWAVAGGVVLVLWIVVQVLLIETYHPLQVLFLLIGIITVLTAWQLKGKWAA